MFDDFLQYPCIVGCDLFVVILVNPSFAEAMALIEPLGIRIGDLYVERYALDFGFVMERCSLNDTLQGLRTQLPGSVGLRDVSISPFELFGMKWDLRRGCPRLSSTTLCSRSYSRCFRRERRCSKLMFLIV